MFLCQALDKTKLIHDWGQMAERQIVSHPWKRNNKGDPISQQLECRSCDVFLFHSEIKSALQSERIRQHRESLWTRSPPIWSSWFDLHFVLPLCARKHSSERKSGFWVSVRCWNIFQFMFAWVLRFSASVICNYVSKHVQGVCLCNHSFGVCVCVCLRAPCIVYHMYLCVYICISVLHVGVRNDRGLGGKKLLWKAMKWQTRSELSCTVCRSLQPSDSLECTAGERNAVVLQPRSRPAKERENTLVVENANERSKKKKYKLQLTKGKNNSRKLMDV